MICISVRWFLQLENINILFYIPPLTYLKGELTICISKSLINVVFHTTLEECFGFICIISQFSC